MVAFNKLTVINLSLNYNQTTKIKSKSKDFFIVLIIDYFCCTANFLQENKRYRIPGTG